MDVASFLERSSLADIEVCTLFACDDGCEEASHVGNAGACLADSLECTNENGLGACHDESFLVFFATFFAGNWDIRLTVRKDRRSRRFHAQMETSRCSDVGRSNYLANKGARGDVGFNVSNKSGRGLRECGENQSSDSHSTRRRVDFPESAGIDVVREAIYRFITERTDAGFMCSCISTIEDDDVDACSVDGVTDARLGKFQEGNDALLYTPFATMQREPSESYLVPTPRLTKRSAEPCVMARGMACTHPAVSPKPLVIRDSNNMGEEIERACGQCEDDACYGAASDLACTLLVANHGAYENVDTSNESGCEELETHIVPRIHHVSQTSMSSIHPAHEARDVAGEQKRTRENAFEVAKRMKQQQARKTGTRYLRRSEGSATSMKELAKYFRLPIEIASAHIGLSPTIIKRICRAHNIRRWPCRKLVSLDRKLAATRARIENTQAKLYELGGHVEGDPCTWAMHMDVASLAQTGLDIENEIKMVSSWSERHDGNTRRY